MLGFLKQRAKRLLIRAVLELLATPEVASGLWEAVHPPHNPHRRGPGDIRAALWEKATRETAEYVEQHMLTIPSCESRQQLFEQALSSPLIDGLYLEFGVATGTSINLIASHVNGIVHGFDSFEGLPHPWFDQYGTGMFSSGGQPPKTRHNVRLHIGPFDKTLPEFTATHEGHIAFVHVDCDLYASTKAIFDHLGDRIVPGTIIQFDEYFNYPGWKRHEYKAFQEFISRRDLQYAYMGYTRAKYTVAVMIK